MKKLITYALIALVGTMNIIGQCYGMNTTSNDELRDEQLLLAQHACPHLRDDDGNTVLILVARKSNAPTEVIKKLIDAGADVDAQNKWGETA